MLPSAFFVSYTFVLTITSLRRSGLIPSVLPAT